MGLLGEDLSWGFLLLVEFLQALEEDWQMFELPVLSAAYPGAMLASEVSNGVAFLPPHPPVLFLPDGMGFGGQEG